MSRISYPQQRALDEARDRRAEFYAEVDRRVLGAILGNMTSIEVRNALVGRYRLSVVETALRRLAERGLVLTEREPPNPRPGRQRGRLTGTQPGRRRYRRAPGVESVVQREAC